MAEKDPLPHTHISDTWDSVSKPRSPKDHDTIACLEIPDKDKFPELHKVVTSFMMYGPPGTANPNSLYKDNEKCTNNFKKN